MVLFIGGLIVCLFQMGGFRIFREGRKAFHRDLSTGYVSILVIDTKAIYTVRS